MYGGHKGAWPFGSMGPVWERPCKTQRGNSRMAVPRRRNGNKLRHVYGVLEQPGESCNKVSENDAMVWTSLEAKQACKKANRTLWKAKQIQWAPKMMHWQAKPTAWKAKRMSFKAKLRLGNQESYPANQNLSIGKQTAQLESKRATRNLKMPQAKPKLKHQKQNPNKRKQTLGLLTNTIL